jgi:hypothetical protein
MKEIKHDLRIFEIILKGSHYSSRKFSSPFKGFFISKWRMSD